MLRFLRFIFPPLFVLVAVSTAWSQETRTVTTEGVAAVQQGAFDIARDAAISDAQKRAVEEAIGIIINSETRVENYQLISDNILSRTSGYITRYNVVSERQDSGLLRVRITAEVSLGKLNDDLAAIGILMSQMNKPRTMILVAEQNIGQDLRGWWMGAQHDTDLSVVEHAFMDKFTEKGFEFIDHEVASKDIRVTPAYKVRDLSPAQAKTLGRQADAEVVIIGKALAKYYGEVGGGMKSVQADMTAKAVRTDTGQVIATTTQHAAAVHISDVSAGTEALKKVANLAADEMITKILESYRKEVGGTRSILITVSGLNKGQFVKFKDVLRNQVRGIKDLHERSFTAGTAKISVDSKTNAQLLSDELLLRDFGSFSVDVVGSTANALELRVAPK